MQSFKKKVWQALWHRHGKLNLCHQCKHPIWVLALVLEGLLSIHLPANAHGKTIENGPSPWARAIHEADLGKVPDS